MFQPALSTRRRPRQPKRVLEFFTAQINNDHTRKTYLNATRRFAEWCGGRGIGQLADVHPFHVAAFVKHRELPASLHDVARKELIRSVLHPRTDDATTDPCRTN